MSWTQTRPEKVTTTRDQVTFVGTPLPLYSLVNEAVMSDYSAIFHWDTQLVIGPQCGRASASRLSTKTCLWTPWETRHSRRRRAVRHCTESVQVGILNQELWHHDIQYVLLTVLLSVRCYGMTCSLQYSIASTVPEDIDGCFFHEDSLPESPCRPPQGLTN
jgi:hypothetical protein